MKHDYSALIRDMQAIIDEQAETIRLLRLDALGVPSLPEDVKQLTPYQERILRVLMRRNAVFDTDSIYRAVYGDEPEPDSNSIQALICQLRKKLPPALKIVNVWGQGYRLERAN